jgi:hypothetical protein
MPPNAPQHAARRLLSCVTPEALQHNAILQEVLGEVGLLRTSPPAALLPRPCPRCTCCHQTRGATAALTPVATAPFCRPQDAAELLRESFADTSSDQLKAGLHDAWRALKVRRRGRAWGWRPCLHSVSRRLASGLAGWLTGTCRRCRAAGRPGPGGAAAGAGAALQRGGADAGHL